ncbi:hypothetical protein BC941DRAFT_439597 [Chlamydoabsidia padenii]|nr:hypothetical protein BC941DRAFT_439597 [Chlamydoabsidia padenii]
MMQSGIRHDKPEECVAPKNAYGDGSTPLQQNDNSPKEHTNRLRQMAFAPDIAQGLINEIRKLQQTIQEKDRLIMDLEINKEDKEKEEGLAQKMLHQKACKEEKLKEDNWNLEVANQDLRSNIVELNKTITKLSSDHSKALQQLQASLDHVEIIKSQQENMTAAMDGMKLKHDNEQQLLRRNNGILHRDVAQLKKRLDDTSTDLKICRAKLSIKTAVNNTGSNKIIDQHGIDNINQTLGDPTNDSGNMKSFDLPTFSGSSQQRALEIETLKQSLGHAHRMVSSLRSNLQKEKIEKIELRRLLVDTQEAMEQLQKESTNDNSNGRKSMKKSSGANRHKVTRKHGRPARKGLVDSGKDEQLESLAVKTTRRDDDMGLILLGSNDFLSGDEHISMDDTSSFNSEDDSGDDRRPDLSPIGHGQNLDMELGLSGLGGTFKSLSSELRNSLTRRHYLDKGVNTYNNVGDRPILEEQHSICVYSNITSSHPASPITIDNDHNNNHTSSNRSCQIVLPVITLDQEPVYQQSSTTTTSLPVGSLDSAYHLPPATSTKNNMQQNQQKDSDIILSTTCHRVDLYQEETTAKLLTNASILDSQHTLTLTLNNTTGAEPSNLGKPVDYVLPQDISTTIGTPPSSSSTTHPINNEIEITPFTNHIINESTQVPTTASHTSTPTLDKMGQAFDDTQHISISPLDHAIENHAIVPEFETSSIPESDHPSLFAAKVGSNFGNQSATTSIVAINQTLSAVDESRSLMKPGLALAEIDTRVNGVEQVELKNKVIHNTHDRQTILGSEKHSIDHTTHVCTQHTTNTEGSSNGGLTQQVTGSLGQETTLVPPEKDNNIDNQHTKPSFEIISQNKADALVNTGIADASAKERLEKVGQKQESGTNIITMAGTEPMTTTRTETALIKELGRAGALIINDGTDTMARMGQERLKDYNNQQHHKVNTKTASTKSVFLAKANAVSRQSNTSVSHAISTRNSRTSMAPSPEASISISSTATVTPSSSSFSRFGILSGLMKLQASLSTPTKAGRPRPSPSVSSMRKSVPPSPQPMRHMSTLGQHKCNPRLNQQDRRDDRCLKSPTLNYGTVRITETAIYSRTAPPSSLRTQQQRQQPIKKRPTQATSSTAQDTSLEVNSYQAPSNADLVLAITQTMIGEWMWKHTRRHVGGGISENKHKRFFWVHPYTRTLYWGNSEPGIDADEAKAKSAFIERVSSIPSHDTMGASPLSLLIRTGKRDLKLTAPTLERHELWRMSLSYLLVPPENTFMKENLIQVDPYTDNSVMTNARCASSTQTLPIEYTNNCNTNDTTNNKIPFTVHDTRSLTSSDGDDGDILPTSTVAAINDE